MAKGRERVDVTVSLATGEIWIRDYVLRQWEGQYTITIFLVLLATENDLADLRGMKNWSSQL